MFQFKCFQIVNDEKLDENMKNYLIINETENMEIMRKKIQEGKAEENARNEHREWFFSEVGKS